VELVAAETMVTGMATMEAGEGHTAVQLAAMTVVAMLAVGAAATLAVRGAMEAMTVAVDWAVERVLCTSHHPDRQLSRSC